MKPDLSAPKLAPHVRHQVDRITGVPMLLHPEGAVELSETADAIVRLCDGVRTTGEIVARLAAEYEAPPEALQADVEACLGELRGRGLLA